MGKFIERSLGFWLGFGVGYVMFRYFFHLGHLAAAFAYIAALVVEAKHELKDELA